MLKAGYIVARRWSLTAALLFSLTAASLAGTSGHASAAADLAPMLEKVRANHGVPALAAIIVDGTRITALEVTGERRAGDTTRAEPDDRWHIGSVGKPMTATLAGRLVDQGVVSFETTLDEALGDLVPDMDPAYRAMTLADLLAHRTGLTDDVSALNIWNADLWLGDAPPHEARLNVARAALAQPPQTAPGRAFNYSDAGYIVAGVLLEQVAGIPFEELLDREVIQPLGMLKTGFGAPGDPASVREPWGHHEGPKGRVAIEPDVAGDNPPAFAPAGTMHASLRDMESFVAAHLAGARG